METLEDRIKASEGKNVCMDCTLHGASTIEELMAIPAKGYCKHFQPEWWEKQGWQRNWGDAAIMAFPILEILRKPTPDVEYTKCQFLILCPSLRRPITISCNDPDAWGSF